MIPTGDFFTNLAAELVYDLLRAGVSRLRALVRGSPEDQALRRALLSSQVVFVTGERAIQFQASANDVVAVTGDGNVITVFKGSDADTIRRIFRDILIEIESDRYTRTLKEYFAALREYCRTLPYLTLYDVHPPRKMDEVYVPLLLRERKQEDNSGLKSDKAEYFPDILQRAGQLQLLILGEPGAGKSTLLRWLANYAWDNPQVIGLTKPHLPMLVPLRTLALADGALEERLAIAIKNELPLIESPPAGFFRAWSQQMHTPWLLLLDGLDEVPENRRIGLMQWLDGILSLIGDGRAIITARSSAYDQDAWKHKPFGTYDLQPFTAGQTKTLAERWFETEAPAFLSAMEKARVVDLSRTPLLLTIAARIYLNRKAETGVGSLPERRSQLYEEFINILLREAELRGLRAELGDAVADVAKPALAHLALAMTEHPEWADEETLARVAAEYLGKELHLGNDHAAAIGRRFVKVMGRRSGVFIPVQSNLIHLSAHGDIDGELNKKFYDWIHPTFREYMAAWWIVRECNMDVECVWKRAISGWASERRNTIGEFAIGILSRQNHDVTFLVERLLEEDWISELHTEWLAWMPVTRHYLLHGELGAMASGFALLECDVERIDWRLRQRVLEEVIHFQNSHLHKAEFSFLARALIPHFRIFLQEITNDKYGGKYCDDYEEIEDYIENLRARIECLLDNFSRGVVNPGGVSSE